MTESTFSNAFSGHYSVFSPIYSTVYHVFLFHAPLCLILSVVIGLA